MDGLMNFLENNLTPIATKIAANKYLKAISGGFIAVMSASIVGSIFTLLGNLPITAYTTWLAQTGLNAILAIPGTFTVNCIALYAAFFIAYTLAGEFKVNGAGAGLASLISFMIITGTTTYFAAAAEGAAAVSAISMDYLGAKGLFCAMFVALVSGRLYVYIVQHGWTIKLPDSVPPNVSGSFTALIPTAIIVTLFLVIAYLMKQTSYGTLHAFVFNVIQSNLMRFAGNNIWSYCFFQLMCNLLWFFGLHGGNITGAITNPIYTPLSLANLAAYEAGEPMPYIITGAFSKSYMSGGVGSMFGMAIVMCLFCKSEQMKTLGRLSLPTTCFFINEPLLFGIPVVLNPVFFLPLMFFTPIMGIITYLLMKAGIVPIPHGIQIPWTTPPVINGFLQGGVGLAIYEAITVVISGIVWWPFVAIADKQALKEEQGAAAE